MISQKATAARTAVSTPSAPSKDEDVSGDAEAAAGLGLSARCSKVDDDDVPVVAAS